MSTCKVLVEGIVSCFINERRIYGGTVYYEISFPPEETYQIVRKHTVLEVHIWLDDYYGAGMWVCE